MADTRWIRLDTTWDMSEWVAELPPEGQLAWVKLLCYVKAHGTQGTVKALPAAVAARMWGVTRNAVTVMLDAANGDDALVSEGGSWTLTGWEEHNPKDPTAASRMRRYRRRQKEKDDLSTEPERNGSDGALRRNVTKTGTETETIHISHTRTGEDALAGWLGDHAGVLDACRFAEDPRARDSLYQQYGPPGLRHNAWRPDGNAVPDDDRPRLFALALSAYASESKARLVASEFDGLLARTIAKERARPTQTGGTMTAEQYDRYLALRERYEAEGMTPQDAAAKAKEAA